MRAKTLLSLLAVFVFLWFGVATFRANQTLVELRLAFLGAFQVELGAILLGAFFAGAGLILFFDIAGGARRMARNWKQRQRHRALEKTEDLYLKALDDMLNGRHEQAVARFDGVLSRDPQHVNALVKRGDSLRELQRYREAAESLERAVRLAPDHLGALYSLSDVYVDLGDEARAETILQRIIYADPKTTVSAYRKLRDLKMKQGDWKEADELQTKIEKMVTLPEEQQLARAMATGIRFELGRAQLSRGELRESIRTLSSVIKRDGGFVPAYLTLGEAKMKAGETEEGLETWRRAHAVTGSLEPLAALQDHYLKADEPEQAIGVWKQAIARSDDETPSRYCLGKLYYRLFMLDQALHELQSIEGSVSGLPALHVTIARILEKKGDLEGAVAKTHTVLEAIEGLMADYACGSCSRRYREWKAQCGGCGQWNTVALDIGSAPAPVPTIRPAPTWSTP